MSRCLVTSLDLHDTCIATLHEMATCSRNTTPKHRVPAPGMPWFPQHPPLNVGKGHKKYLSGENQRRAAARPHADLHKRSFSSFFKGIWVTTDFADSVQMHVFVFWGKKKKAGTFNGNLKSLEEPNVPELCDWHSVWTTVFKAACCSLGFWLFFKQRRNWTCWAAGLDPPSPTTPGNLSSACKTF